MDHDDSISIVAAQIALFIDQRFENKMEINDDIKNDEERRYHGTSAEFGLYVRDGFNSSDNAVLGMSNRGSSTRVGR